MRKVTLRQLVAGLWIRCPVVAVAAALGSGGCATSSLSPEAQKVRSETYETVYTVGSHIPRKVRRGEDAASNDGASPVAVIEGEKARETVRRMQRRN